MPERSIEIIQVVELPASVISLRGDGLIQVEMKVLERELVENDVRDLTRTIGTIGKGKTFPVLILIKESNSIEKRASQFASSEECLKYTKANAIVVNSLAIRIGANFYVTVFKPIRPTKMFNSEEAAVEWLKTFL